jgi:hypothetical protein
MKDLMQKMPISHPIRIIFCALQGAYAETYILDEGKESARFIIRFAKDTDDELLDGTLIHEYAHAVSWYWEDADHGPSFGIAQARLWALLYD